MPKTANSFNYVGIIDITLEDIQINIYRYDINARNLQLEPHAQTTCHTGLNPDINIENNMEQLINTAKAAIPQQKHQSTMIYLYGSESYVLIPSEIQTGVLERTYQYLKNTPFTLSAFSRAEMIISGHEQAALSWLAVNYLENSHDPFSVLDISTFGINFAYEVPKNMPEATKILTRPPKYLYTNTWFDSNLDSISGCLPSYANISTVAGKENYAECQVMMNDIVKPFKAELHNVQQANLHLVEQMYLTNDFDTFYRKFNREPKKVVEACNMNTGLDTDCAQGVLGQKLSHDLQYAVKLKYEEINDTRVEWTFARALLHAYSEKGSPVGIEINGTLRFGRPSVTHLTLHLALLTGAMVILWIVHKFRHGFLQSDKRIQLGEEVEMDSLTDNDRDI